MRCLVCGSGSKVIDVDKAQESVKRRRECTSCGHRWNTLEQVLGAPVKQKPQQPPEPAKPAGGARRLQAVKDLAEIYDEDLDDIMRELGL